MSSSSLSFGTLQQAFCLSFWSNGVSKERDKSPAELASDLAAYLSGKGTGKFHKYSAEIGSDWRIVWGPAVYVVGAQDNNLNGEITTAASKIESELDSLLDSLKYRGIADNAIYVAYNNADTYVVAIAATNPQSLFDWLDEDGRTDHAVPFVPASSMVPDPSLKDALVSAGTALGVEILEKLMPSDGQQSPNVTLQDYLSSVEDTGKTLIFAGHSLGGALSPTLAISLFPSQDAKAVWKEVYVVPTAGATPGDQNFATGFNTVFPQMTDSTAPTGTPNIFNTDTWNQYDVVPHAWDNLQGASFPQYVAPPPHIENLEDATAECIFGTLQGRVVTTFVKRFFGFLKWWSDRANVAYTPIQTQAFLPSSFPSPATLPNCYKNPDPGSASNAAASDVTWTPVQPPLPNNPPQQTITDVPTFFTMLVQQHIGAYYSLMGVTAISDPQTTSDFADSLIKVWKQIAAKEEEILEIIADSGDSDS